MNKLLRLLLIKSFCFLPLYCYFRIQPKLAHNKELSTLQCSKGLVNSFESLTFKQLMETIPSSEVKEYKLRNLLFEGTEIIPNETPSIGTYAVANPKGFIRKPEIAKLYGFDISVVSI